MSEETDKLLIDEIVRAKNAVEVLKPLVSSAGWSYVQGLIDAQVHTRRFTQPSASEGFGDVFRKEFSSGEIAGLLIARNLAETALETAESILEGQADATDEE